MKTSKDRQFELIQQLLTGEISSGNTPQFASQRTLFGIKSSQELVVDRVVAEENERILQHLQNEKLHSDKESTEEDVTH